MLLYPVLLLVLGNRPDVRYAVNLTLYHVNEKNYTGITVRASV